MVNNIAAVSEPIRRHYTEPGTPTQLNIYTYNIFVLLNFDVIEAQRKLCHNSTVAWSYFHY